MYSFFLRYFPQRLAIFITAFIYAVMVFLVLLEWNLVEEGFRYLNV